MAGAMAGKPAASLPAQCEGDKAELAASYRFLNNEAVKPERIIEGALDKVLGQIRGLKTVLCVQDTTELDFSRRQAEGLGQIGNGCNEGLLQHSALAVDPEAGLLGVLHVNTHVRHKKPKGETRRQSQARRNEGQVWSEAARAVGRLDTGTARVLHVCDRGADIFGFMETCEQLGHGHVVRAMHDRKTKEGRRLWEHMDARGKAGELTVKVPMKKKGQKRTGWREAKAIVKHAPVQIEAPRNDPRYAESKPLKVWAVQVVEQEAPAGCEPVEWMLLVSEAINDVQDAYKAIGYYKRRWTIEEWHRCLKQGCGVEKTQLRDGEAIKRLAAMKSVVATRLLQVREQARDEEKAKEPAHKHVPEMQVKALEKMKGKKWEQISVGEYWEAVARLGGWLGRKNDAPPGWLVIWRGYEQLELIALGLSLATKSMHDV